MARIATINARTEPEVKAQAEELYASFGLTLSDAINIFLRKSLDEGGLPFALRRPRYSAETLAAMQEAEDIAEGRVKAQRYRSVDEMMTAILED